MHAMSERALLYCVLSWIDAADAVDTIVHSMILKYGQMVCTRFRQTRLLVGVYFAAFRHLCVCSSVLRFLKIILNKCH